MIGRVNILNKEILIEPHKRKPIDQSVEEELLIDLSHTIENGLITYKGLPAPLRDCEVTLVGIDSHNIDDTTGRTRPVHTVLLGAGILIVEHLCNLHKLPAENFSFTAAPPKFKGVGTFPVRAFASVEKK